MKSSANFSVLLIRGFLLEKPNSNPAGSYSRIQEGPNGRMERRRIPKPGFDGALRSLLRGLRGLSRHARRQREIQGGDGQSLRHKAGRNRMLRVHAAESSKEDLRVLQSLPDPQLHNNQRVLLLPPVRQLALRSHRKVLFRHRGKGYEKGNTDLAGESRRTWR